MKRYRPYHRLTQPFKDGWYWLRYHLWTRRHIIDISGEDGYRWGWIDADHAMYLACFKLLREFIEQETDESYGLETVTDYDYDELHEWSDGEKEALLAQIARHAEVRAIYDWWMWVRKDEHRSVQRYFEDHYDPDRPAGPEALQWERDLKMGSWDCDASRDEWHRLNDQADAKDLEMLDRLMKVRQSLWT